MPRKSYGIRITLPEGDPLRAAHLLGPDWEGFRWYETAGERNAAYEDMLRELPIYRSGDVISQILQKVER
ncbi:MAG: hypothetical protein WCC36_07630 [Gammaproteobacteria bacterium]